MKHRAALFLSAIVSVLFFVSPVSADRSLPVLLSSGSALPESIGRETFAAIDRTCDSLLDSGLEPGAWTAALADPELKFPQRDEALKKVIGAIDMPWTAERMREASLVLLGCAFAQESAPEAVSARLARAPLGELDPADCAIALVALDCAAADTADGWEALARRPLPPNPSLGDIAAAALSRLARNRRYYAESQIPPDVLAYVRWLSSRLKLEYRSDGDPKYPLEPRSALLISWLGAMIPRSILARDDSLLPIDWRNHLANRLIALQSCPEPGIYIWESSSGQEESIPEATAEAVLALRLLSAR